MTVWYATSANDRALLWNSEAECINLGLVNNMPDSALEATERHFLSLLAAAADGLCVHLTFYALPDVPREEFGRRHIRSYCSIEELWNGHLDGLIVTGTEPRAVTLPDEPYWGSLTRLVDWADQHTYSSVWSCLSAHAAVLHIDGIHRRPLSGKRFGVFDCHPAEDHQLTFGVPAHLQMPHSRWNEIPEDLLESCDYRILIASRNAGADMFIKQQKSLLIFFQDHPEYESDTLLLEYRRDIKRFLKGEKTTYPEMPEGYFTPETVSRLLALRKRAMENPAEEILADFSADLSTVASPWRPHAVQIYRNWLCYIAQQRARSPKAIAVFRKHGLPAPSRPQAAHSE